MNYYFAPLEGITEYIFRNVHHKYYAGVDKYYAPFISPAREGSMTWKEKNDLVAEHNEQICVVPQVMTNHAGLFIRALQDLRDMGYREVNLNLGCPSKTVTAKGKGAGFLARGDALEQFFDEVFSCKEIKDIQISVKTRLGKNDPEEFKQLLKMYNWYPISELTVHPRVQQDFYKGAVRMEYFDYALLHSSNRLVYNGDLCKPEQIEGMKEHIRNITNENLCSDADDCAVQEVTAMMLGRGMLRNPELIMWQRENDAHGLAGTSEERKIDYRRLKAFHDELYARYKEVMSPDKNVLYRMKELWCYLGEAFPDGDKYIKQIRKAERFPAYDAAIMQLFQR